MLVIGGIVAEGAGSHGDDEFRGGKGNRKGFRGESDTGGGDRGRVRVVDVQGGVPGSGDEEFVFAAVDD